MLNEILLPICILFLALGFIGLYLSICRVERERMNEDSELHRRIGQLRADMSRAIETHADKSSFDL